MSFSPIFFLVSASLLGPISADKCTSIGGTCGSPGACSGGLLVTNRCFEKMSDKCCVNVLGGVSKTEQHLNFVEGGLAVQAYVPSEKSGATVATGYDIGNGPDISKCVGPELWTHLLPVRPFKTNSSLIKAGYDTKDLLLNISFDEARKIDSCLLVETSALAKKCSTSTDVCVSSVLISLAHWCGPGGFLQGKETKCSGVNRGEEYMKYFCAKKNGNKAALLSTLQDLLNVHLKVVTKDTRFKVTRVSQEIDFLKSCQP